MRTYLLYAALLLSACATTKPSQEQGPYVQPPHHGADVGTPPKADTTHHNATPSAAHATKPSAARLIGQLWPFKQDDKKSSDSRGFNRPTSAPRKCKGCTFNVVGGDQTNATAGKGAAVGAGAVASKNPDAPVATGASTALATGGGAAASGAGARAEGGGTVKEAPGPLATLAGNLTGWVPYAVGIGLILAIIFRKRLPVVGAFFS